MSVARGGSGFEDSVALGRGLGVVVDSDSEVVETATGGGFMVYLVVIRVCWAVS